MICYMVEKGGSTGNDIGTFQIIVKSHIGSFNKFVKLTIVT